MGRSAPIIKPDNVFVRYFKDTRAEISKVTWPTREEGIRLTWVVLVVTVISALILSGLDLLFSTLVVFIVGAH
ncbi:MAG: preprotein translocase subunit SecE [Caldilineaceae bacterium]